MIFLILDARAQWCAFNIVTRAKAPQWFFFNFFYFTMDADRAKENASKHPYSCTRCHIWLSEHRLWHKPRFVCLFCPCKRSNVRTQPLLGKCNCWLQGGQGSCLIVHCLSVFELASVSHVHRQLKSGKLPHDITVDVPSVDLFGWYSVLHTGDPPLVCGYAGFWGFRLMM